MSTVMVEADVSLCLEPSTIIRMSHYAREPVVVPLHGELGMLKFSLHRKLAVVPLCQDLALSKYPIVPGANGETIVVQMFKDILLDSCEFGGV